MTEENKVEGDELNKDDKPKGDEVIVNDQDMVKLTPDAYSALLDRLDELETKGKSGGKETLDSLASTGTQRLSRPPISDEDLETMRPKELINTILGHIEETRIQPLLVKIEEMNVRNEIRELTRDGKNQDFFDLKDVIYEVASKNPQLTIEEALVLARQKAGYTAEGKKPEIKANGANKDLLRTLPPRKNVPSGEKPGVNRVVTNQAEPETRLDAARMALADMKKAGKI